MMRDCISREDAINEICRKGCQMERANRLVITMHEAKQFAVDVLVDIPAVNVRENVRGEWIEHDDETPLECSICGFEENRFYNFCPNCGADLRGV